MDIVLKTSGVLTISLVVYLIVTLRFVWEVFRSKANVGGERLDVEFSSVFFFF